MKKLFLVIAVLAAFVSSAFAADSAKEPVVFEKFTVIAFMPPKEVKLEKIEASGNEVHYRVSWNDGAASAFFNADGSGKLSYWHIVHNDSIIASYKAIAMSGGEQWVQSGNVAGDYTVDPSIWAKFFVEKIQPAVPVTIAESQRFVLVEHGRDSQPTKYESMGTSYDPKGVRQVLVRKIGTKYVRNLPESDFAVLPPEGREFYLGRLNGRLCAVESLTVGDKSIRVVAVDVIATHESL